MHNRIVLCVMMMSVGINSVNGDNVLSHHDGIAFAKEAKKDAEDKAESEGKGFLTESSAQDVIEDYSAVLPEDELKPEKINERANPLSEAAMRVRDQLSGSRMVIDPITDPMFVNANKAIANPAETLKKQECVVVDMNEAEEKPCIETRDEEFEVVNSAQIDPYYKRFEVWQFFNHCPNTPSHCGWGKRNDCPNYQRNQSILKPTRRPEADHEEIHGMQWKMDKHPDLDHLLARGKCRLTKEMPKEEGKEARMIPVEFYKKEEVCDQRDWNITKIEEHREERSRLKRPEDFGLESFVKIQVYTCSYQSPGNTCTVLRKQGAIEKISTCIKWIGGVCVEWEKIYTVPKPGSEQTVVHDISEGHIDALNADGALNDTTYAENREGAEAIARLTAVHDVGAAMPKINTGDANALSVFRGNDHRCVSQAGNNRCPGGNGKKEAGDQALEQKVNEGKCIVIGVYEPDTQNIGTLIGQKRTTTTYCCYDSVLAKVLHQGAIDQGIKDRGDPKTTTCGALTIAQLQAMVWERVDFTPFVNEVTSKVNLNPVQVGERSGKTVRAHLDNQMRGARQQAQLRAARS